MFPPGFSLNVIMWSRPHRASSYLFTYITYDKNDVAVLFGDKVRRALP